MIKEWSNSWNPFNSAKALMWREWFEGFAKEDFLPPVTVDTDPSSKCNYSCLWCNADTIIKQKGQKEISRDQLFRLSDFYAEWGVNSTCFTGDTKIKLVDGTNKTFEELIEIWNKNHEPFEVYSRDSEGKIVPGLAHSPRKITVADILIELTLDTGDIVRCTPEHRFMLRDRTYKEAQYLTNQDSLMPLYFEGTDSGYEFLKEIGVGGLTHRVFGNYYYPGSIEEGKIFHHNVVSIRKIELEYSTPVYCLTVEKYHNFALSAGIFVENCVAGGGEPLMNNNTPDFLVHLKTNGIESGLITNGSLIDSRTAEIIAENCRWVGISMDAGTELTYQKIKGLSEHRAYLFEGVISNIEKVVNCVKDSNNKCDVCYKYLLHPLNAREIYKAAELAKSIGVKDFHLRPVGWDNIPKTQNQEAPDYQGLYEEIDDQIERAMQLEDENFHFYGIRHKFNPNFTRKINFSCCWAAPLILTFGADGNCHLCFDMRGREDLILCSHDPDPHEVLKHWNTPRHKEMLKNIDVNKCPRCTFGAYNEIVEKVFIQDSMCRYFP